MVPPGIPGRSDTSFLPAVRSGRGTPGAGRRGLSRWHGISVGDPDHDRHGLRCGDPGRPQSEPRDHGQRRDDGLRRLLQPAGDRPANLLDAQLGGRLSRRERLPGPAPGHRQHEQLRPLELERVRCGNRRCDGRHRPDGGHQRPSMRPRRSSSARCRSCRSPTGPARRCREAGCSERRTTAWASCASPAWPGRRESPEGLSRVGRLRPGRPVGGPGSRPRGPRCDDDGNLRAADRIVRVRDLDHVQRRGQPYRRAPPGRAAPDGAGGDRPDGDPGPDPGRRAPAPSAT